MFTMDVISSSQKMDHNKKETPSKNLFLLTFNGFTKLKNESNISEPFITMTINAFRLPTFIFFNDY
jgi:hypothetical protein